MEANPTMNKSSVLNNHAPPFFFLENFKPLLPGAYISASTLTKLLQVKDGKLL